MATVASLSTRSGETPSSGFVRAHPLLSYFALTFAISWGGVLLAVSPGEFPATPEQFANLRSMAIVAMLAGPPVAGLVMTGLIEGRAGLRVLLYRLLAWRLDPRWYALALLTAPVATLVVLYVLSPFSDEYVPAVTTVDDRTVRLTFGIAVALGAGIFEEIGWTGFAAPRLRLRYGVLGGGLVLGFLWSAWHLLVGVWSSRTYTADVPVPVFLIAGLFSTLFVYRVAMVWLYERTGSALLAVLMHASLTACTLILNPPTTGVRLLTFDLTMAATLWIVVGAIAVANGGHLSGRRPTTRRLVDIPEASR